MTGYVWTVDEVAVRLRVSRMTVYRLIHADILHAMRVGRSLRITDEALKTYMEGAGCDGAQG